ncbi:MAG TPA: hypothetical protein VMT17_02895 [Anaeromyxobacteraceae bacterium]|nr:hypothetical protein [Anaeromyxobacteraceae bacterium]
MRPVPRLALLLLAAAAAACAHAGDLPTGASAPERPGRYFPLAVGNEWTYVDRSPQLAVGDARRRTVRIVSLDRDGYYVDSARGALRAGRDCIEDRSRRILCTPFEVGRRWSSVVSVGSTEHYEIAGVGETVHVPAGTFEGCVRVRARTRAGPDAENVLEISYAPGVGPVRIETYAVVQGKVTPQVIGELASYRTEERR